MTNVWEYRQNYSNFRRYCHLHPIGEEKNTQNNPLLIGTLVHFKLIQQQGLIIGVSKCKGSQVKKY